MPAPNQAVVRRHRDLRRGCDGITVVDLLMDRRSRSDRAAIAALSAILACQGGCYFLVDLDGISGPAQAVDSGSSDAGSSDAGPSDAAPSDAKSESEMAGLVGYWSFDDTDGNVVQDLSGQGNHGVLGSGSLLPEGLKGRGLGSPMTVASLGGENFPPRGTLSFWLRADFTGAEKVGREYFSNYETSRAQIYVRVPNAVRPGDGLVLQIACQAPGIGLPFAAEIPSPPNDTWMHLVVVWDSDAHRALAYLDGVLLRESSLPESWRPSDQPVVFGRTLLGGLVDEVRLYSRPLSSREVREIP